MNELRLYLDFHSSPIVVHPLKPGTDITPELFFSEVSKFMRNLSAMTAVATCFQEFGIGPRIA
jgi:hypothetical protein